MFEQAKIDIKRLLPISDSETICAFKMLCFVSEECERFLCFFYLQ